MPKGVAGIQALCRVSARDILLARRRCYFFFVLVLLLLAVFGLAARLVILPDPHPHRLHAISAPFRKDIHISRTIYLYFIGCMAPNTLGRVQRPAPVLPNQRRPRSEHISLAIRPVHPFEGGNQRVSDTSPERSSPAGVRACRD